MSNSSFDNFLLRTAKPLLSPTMALIYQIGIIGSAIFYFINRNNNKVEPEYETGFKAFNYTAIGLLCFLLLVLLLAVFKFSDQLL